jgi:adenylate cyclase class 2
MASFINIELKACTTQAAFIRQFLLDNKADFKGTDLQTDTYFHVPNGRLKLRQGNIENNLIWYQRSNQASAKQSDFLLTPVGDTATLLQTLTNALGIKVTVIKKREIYFIDNVKFHLDELGQLGNFVEIEASNKTADISVEKLKEQCEHYRTAFKIQEEDLLQYSYSDMLLEKGISG